MENHSVPTVLSRSACMFFKPRSLYTETFVAIDGSKFEAVNNRDWPE